MCETEKNCGLFWKFFVSVLRQKEVSHLALSAYFIISGQETETDARTCSKQGQESECYLQKVQFAVAGRVVWTASSSCYSDCKMKKAQRVNTNTSVDEALCTMGTILTCAQSLPCKDTQSSR